MNTEDKKTKSTLHDEQMMLGYMSLLLSERAFSRAQDGSISLKSTGRDAYGKLIDLLLFGDNSGEINSKPAVLKLASLKAIIELDELPADDLMYEFNQSCFHKDSPSATFESLMHSVCEARAVILVTHNSLMSIGCISNWREKIEQIYGGHILGIDYMPNRWDLLKHLKKSVNQSDLDGVFLRYHGMMVFGENLDNAYEKINRLVDKAEKYLFTGLPKLEREKPGIPLSHPLRYQLSEMRKELSASAGKPLLVHTNCDTTSVSRVQNEKFIAELKRGAFSDLHDRTFPSSPVDGFASNIKQKEIPSSLIILDQDTGICITAETPEGLRRNGDIQEEIMSILENASRIGKIEPICIDHPFIDRVDSAAPTFNKSTLFAGEIALVTGAASGIGKACVLSLIERGAAVVGLDINEEIMAVSSTDNYLGIICDLANEKAVADALENIVRHFGGLDMLILNAGIFPPSCNLDSLSLDLWRNVMQINLDSNITIMREAFPLLKKAPRYGRVVINASRNVTAPGPGAAAYSASKAALTQVGRVAALEWGKDGIRVNIVHPNAVFDTGIWTNEVITSRAVKYGLSVEDYKANNILGTELHSRDISELIAEMCGPLFAKITGAQVPIDGGSDRVI